MSSIVKILPRDRDDLAHLHEELGTESCLTGCSTAAAAFLIIGALIVIFSASLCFTLPGVNVMKDIILPAYLPSLGAILLGIPLAVQSFRHNQKIAPLLPQIIDKTTVLIMGYNVDKMPKKDRAEFIRDNFLKFDSYWLQEYKAKIINGVKEKLEKEPYNFPNEYDNQNERQRDIIEALDKSIEKPENS